MAYHLYLLQLSAEEIDKKVGSIPSAFQELAFHSIDLKELSKSNLL